MQVADQADFRIVFKFGLNGEECYFVFGEDEGRSVVTPVAVEDGDGGEGAGGRSFGRGEGHAEGGVGVGVGRSPEKKHIVLGVGGGE